MFFGNLKTLWKKKTCRKPKSKLGPSTGVGRAQIPKAISMDFKIRPQPRVDLELQARVKKQMDSSIRGKVSVLH